MVLDAELGRGFWQQRFETSGKKSEWRSLVLGV